MNIFGLISQLIGIKTLRLTGCINYSFFSNVQSSRTKIVSPPLPSNFVHSLSYQHPLYYQWQLPILNPEMEIG